MAIMQPSNPFLAALEPTEAPKDKPVFVPAIKRSLGGMVEGTGHLLSAAGADNVGAGMIRYGQGVQEANPAQYKLSDALEHPGGFVSETLGELIPTAVGMAIPGGLAAKGVAKFAAPFAERVFTPIAANSGRALLKGGIQTTGKGLAAGAGMFAGSTAMETGDILGQQMQDTGEYNLPRAAAYGALAGSLDTPLAGGGGAVMGRALGGAGRVAERLAGRGAEKVGLSTIPKEMLKVGAVEGAQEGAQTGLEQQGVEPEGFSKRMSTDAGIDDMLTSMVKGFIGGSAFGAASGGAKHLTEARRLREEINNELNKPVEENKAETGFEDTTVPEVPETPPAVQTLQRVGIIQNKMPSMEISPEERFMREQSANRAARKTQEELARYKRQQQEENAPPATEGYAVEELPDESITISANDRLIEAARKQYNDVTTAAVLGQITDIQAADKTRARAAQLIEKLGGTPPTDAKVSLVAHRTKFEAAETALGALRAVTNIPRSVRQLIADRVIAQPDLKAMANEIMAISEDGSLQIPSTARQKLDAVARDLGNEEPAAKEAGTSTNPKAVNATKQGPGAANEQATATSQGTVTQAAAQKENGAGSAVASQARTETKPAAASKTARNGASTTQREINGLQKEGRNAQTTEAQVKEAPNAVQERSAKTDDVGAAPRGSEAVGQGISQSRETARKTGNAKAKKISDTYTKRSELTAKQQAPSAAKFYVAGEKPGEMREVTAEEYAKLHPKKRVSKAEATSEVPTLEPQDTFENTANSFADMVFDGHKFERPVYPMPNQPKYDEAVKAGKVADVFNLIKEHFKGNKEMSKLVEWVQEKAGDVKLKFVNQDMTDDYGRYVGGEYDPATHTVTIYQGGSNPVVLAHELAHAAMERELQVVEAYQKSGKKSEVMVKKVKAYNELQKQYEKFKTAMPNSEEYGLTDLHEFMAEVFSNPDFRGALQTQPTYNFWQRLVRAIAKFLGFKTNEQQALEDIFDAANTLAYRAPGAVYMPSDVRAVYHKSGIFQSISKEVDKQSWFDKALDALPSPVANKLSEAANFITKQKFNVSSMHNIVERLKDEFVSVVGEKNVRTLEELWQVMQGTDTLASKLNQLTGLQGQHEQEFLEADKKRGQDAIHIAMEQSLLGLTDSDILDTLNKKKDADGRDGFNRLLQMQHDAKVAAAKYRQEVRVLEANKSKMAQSDYLAEKKRLKDNKVRAETSRLHNNEETRERFATLINKVRQYGWMESRPRTLDQLTKIDGKQWTTREFVHAIHEQNRRSATQYYDLGLRSLYARTNPDKQAGLVVMRLKGTATSKTDFAESIAKVKERLDALLNSGVLTERQQETLESQIDMLDDWYETSLAYPYMHVSRKGDFFISLVAPTESATDSDRVVRFIRFTSKQAMTQALNEIKANEQQTISDNGWRVEYGKMADFNTSESVEGVRKLAAVLQSTIHNMDGVSKEQADIFNDLVNQTMYRMLPETSSMKSFIHRKGVAGWNVNEQFQGHLQQLVQNNFRYANNRFLPESEYYLDLMRQQVRDEQEDGNPKAIKHQYVLDELNKRHVQSFIDVETPLSDAARSVVYNWQLAWSPAYLITNLMQPYMITLPVLGAKYGFVKSAAALKNGYVVGAKVLKAMASHGFLKTVSYEEIEATLKAAGLEADELAAVTYMLESGKVEFSLAKEAGMLSEGRSLGAAKVAKFLSMGSHYSEVLNRISTGVATYELEMARQKSSGADHATALDAAEKKSLWAIDETQVYYSRLNMPRAMGKHGYLGPVTPLFTTFMFFNVNMIEMYLRIMRRMADKTEMNAADRKEAWRAFTGLMLTTGSVAGVMGLPIAPLIMLAMNVAGSGGDDDEPYQADVSLRSWLAQWLGKEGGLAAAHGLPTLVGTDMYTRAGQDNILPFYRFLTDHRSLSDMPADAMLRSLSPTISTILSGAVGVSKAHDYLVNGDAAAGDAVIRALPAALRGAATAAHGYHDYAGTSTNYEPTAAETAAQILGYSPVGRLEQMFMISASRDKMTKLNKNAEYIKKNWAHALDEGDQEEAKQWADRWATFTKNNPVVSPNPGIGERLKKMNADRAFYKMTGLGARMSPRQFQDAYGLAQNLLLADEESGDEE